MTRIAFIGFPGQIVVVTDPIILVSIAYPALACWLSRIKEDPDGITGIGILLPTRHALRPAYN